MNSHKNRLNTKQAELYPSGMVTASILTDVEFYHGYGNVKLITKGP